MLSKGIQEKALSPFSLGEVKLIPVYLVFYGCVRYTMRSLWVMGRRPMIMGQYSLIRAFFRPVAYGLSRKCISDQILAVFEMVNILVSTTGGAAEVGMHTRPEISKHDFVFVHCFGRTESVTSLVTSLPIPIATRSHVERKPKQRLISLLRLFRDFKNCDFYLN